MSRIKASVSALILSLGVCGVALAQQPQPTNPGIAAQQPGRDGFPRRPMHRRGEPGRQRALEQINLTDAEKQQVRSIIQTQAQNTQSQREEMRQLRMQQRTGTLTPEGRARAQVLRQQLMESRKGVHGQMMNVLTSEQKSRIQEMRELRRANHQRFGRRRQPLD